MTLAMSLDSSFEIMNEDEMYYVNGGKKLGRYSNLNGVIHHFGKWMLFSALSFKNIAKGDLNSIKNVATMTGKMVRIFADMGMSTQCGKLVYLQQHLSQLVSNW